MCVAGAAKIFRRATELHQDSGFVDHVARTKTDNVNAEDTVCILIRKNLYFPAL